MRVVSVALCSLALASCTGKNPVAVGSGPAEDPSALPGPTSTGRLGAVELTSADSGRTVPVRLGQSVHLSLDDADSQWSGLRAQPPGLLTAASALPASPARTVSVYWTARAAGTVDVSATATAWCPAGTICPNWAKPFRVTLNIA